MLPDRSQHDLLAVETIRYTFRVFRSYNLVSRGVFTRSRACIDEAPNISPLQASRALPKTLDRVLARTGVIAADVEAEAAEAAAEAELGNMEEELAMQAV